jgi:hypothetical protein
MGKQYICICILLALGCGLGRADENRIDGTPGKKPFLKGGLGAFELNIDLDTVAFELESTELSDIELRKWKGSHDYPGNYRGERISWPFSGINWFTDTNVSLAYDAGIFGGTLGLCVEAPKDNYMVKASTIKAWTQPVKYFRATAGIDIGFDYADSLDADPGVRIYDGATLENWAHTRSTDDITQDEGILLEGFFGPVTVAMAGRYYNPTLFSIDVNGSQDEHTTFEYVNQAEFSYGARVGSEIGAWGKVDASYIIEYSNSSTRKGANNQYGLDRDKKIVPIGALAEIYTHLFGLFASLTPLPDFGVTVGYNGIVTSYTSEFYSKAIDEWQDTAVPLVYQQGVNMNLRYKGLPRWTFRSDNCLSFWTDKNYSIFSLPNTADMGIVSRTAAEGYADVDHFVVWNGLGVVYQITKTWKGELYARNLFRNDIARESTAMNADKELAFSRDELRVELKGIWQPADYFEFYAGVEVKNEMTVISEQVNRLTTTAASNNTGFKTGVEPRETMDTVFTFRVPMGMTVKMR